MSGEFSADWLTLREPADAAARDAGLADLLRERLRAPLTVRDLGCGTGSMGRWLAPRLPYPQHWVLMDRDPALLTHAGTHLPDAVTVETRVGDVTALTGADLAGTSLVTCSALLDLFTPAELDGLVAACAANGTAALFTLSVTGQVAFDGVDTAVQDAFNDHQRRGGKLGPDAGDHAAAAFTKAGAQVWLRETPWRLGAEHAALTAQWFTGWVAAAREQRPELRTDTDERRPPGDVTVGHVDLLATFD